MLIFKLQAKNSLKLVTQLSSCDKCEQMDGTNKDEEKDSF